MAGKTIGVLGLGVFGSTIAKELGENGYDVIAVDNKQEDIERIEPYVVKAVEGDIGDLKLLQSIGFENCDVAVVATGSSLESSVLAVLNCKKLKIEQIIAKAKNKVYKEILESIGATQVVRSEKEMGVKIARNLMRNNILEVFDIDEHVAIIEFFPPKKWIGKTLNELDLRREFEINIIGIKTDMDSKMNVYIDPEYKISQSDLLIAIGHSDKFERLDYTQQLN